MSCAGGLTRAPAGRPTGRSYRRSGRPFPPSRTGPTAEADRSTLIRRLTLDLTGLPPGVADVDEFLADTRPGAYERLVDRVLASKHFGERMAQPWLDLARFGDSDGYHDDTPRVMW